MTDYAGSYNGLAFGQGTPYRLRKIRWYRRSTAILTSNLPLYHGGIPGSSFESPRTVDLDMMVEASTASELVTRLDALFAAFQPSITAELPLVFGLPGQSNRRIVCRPRAGDSELDPSDWASKSEEVALRLEASDPAIYADSESTLELTPYASSGGLSYPVTYPKVYPGGGSGGGSVAANAGDWETWPTITIDGPSTGTMNLVSVENVTTGLTLALTANGGVAMSAGQQLIIEMHPRSIAFSTGASRYGKHSGDFWPLQPGNNELRFRATGTTTAAKATVAWRSAWI